MDRTTHHVPGPEQDVLASDLKPEPEQLVEPLGVLRELADEVGEHEDAREEEEGAQDGTNDVDDGQDLEQGSSLGRAPGDAVLQKDTYVLS